MASTYTANNRLEKPGTGDYSGTWGAVTNAWLERLEDMLGRSQTKSVTGGSYTLSTANGAADEARYSVQRISGALVSAQTIVIPNVEKFYLLSNETSGAYSLTFSHAAPTLTLAVTQGCVRLAWSDGAGSIYPVGPEIVRSTQALNLASADVAGGIHAATTVASSSTTDIGAATTDRIIVSGTTAITSFGTSANRLRFVHFSGALILTHNATTLILPGAGNITTAAGDCGVFSSDSSGNWRCLAFLPASGSPFSKTQTANTVWAGPTSGSAAVPTFRTMVNADLPSPPGICEGRLTLTSGTAVTTSDVTAATNAYFTPYLGNRVALYDGSANWVIRTFTEITISLAGLAADTNFDLFAYDSAGTITFDAPLAWSNSGAGTSARATALVLQDGVYVKSGAPTRRYIGTLRTTGTIGQCEDSEAKRFLWNAHILARRRRSVKVIDTTDSWTYTTTTWRQARATATNQVAVIQGLAEDVMDIHVTGAAINATPCNIGVGVGINSTSANSANVYYGTALASTTTAIARYFGIVTTVGYNTVAWLEISQAIGTTTWNGDSGLTYTQCGLCGVVLA